MKKYIEQEFVFPQKKQIKVRSRETRDTHIEIHCYTSDREDREKIKKEIQKAIRKMNHLLNGKVSCKWTITLK
ncbi:MAG: hypothetical protein OSJ60_01810 [Lachnospiraceae bacterium]|nr:hypothetical protein C819_02262 [Lachnospiraceae bacterium 10-1]MCX4350348.1 hypothetical protein [Lachnospiraceae bacterium]